MVATRKIPEGDSFFIGQSEASSATLVEQII